MPHPCLQFIEQQADIVRDAIAQQLGGSKSWALTDFPNYANIGDSAIWVGQYKTLKSITGREADFVATNDQAVFDPADYAALEGPLFFVGGGNFGDLYPRHQNYKLQVLRSMKGRRVVQLSQSVHFKDLENILETARAIKEHGNFCFFARDRETYAFVSEHFDCDVELVPDGAFGMGALRTTKVPTLETLQFRREDIESVSGGMPGSVDWPRESRLDLHLVRWRATALALLSGKFDRMSRRRAVFSALSQWRLKRGVDLLSSANTIVCDRLHVHILATLLGIPHTFLDNSTGKITAYYQAWTHGCGTGKPAVSAS